MDKKTREAIRIAKLIMPVEIEKNVTVVQFRDALTHLITIAENKDKHNCEKWFKEAMGCAICSKIILKSPVKDMEKMKELCESSNARIKELETIAEKYDEVKDKLYFEDSGDCHVSGEPPTHTLEIYSRKDLEFYKAKADKYDKVVERLEDLTGVIDDRLNSDCTAYKHIDFPDDCDVEAITLSISKDLAKAIKSKLIGEGE